MWIKLKCLKWDPRRNLDFIRALSLRHPPPRDGVCVRGEGDPPQVACDRVITVGAVRLGDLVIGRQERVADRRCASYYVDQSLVSPASAPPHRHGLRSRHLQDRPPLPQPGVLGKKKISDLISAKLLKLPSEVRKCCVAIVAQALPRF